jgi:hypothetical protein
VKTIITAIIVSKSLASFACDCAEVPYEMQFEHSVESSDLIFIGRPIWQEEWDYEIEIIEILKGEFDCETVLGSGRTSCDLWPEPEDGLWIIYTSMRENGEIGIYDCGLSRPLKSLNITPEPPQKDLKNEADMEVNAIEQVSLAKYQSSIQLQKEIAELRKRRDN